MYKKSSQTVNPSILIVDDVPANLKLLGEILKDEGYSIAFAVDGPQAISTAKEVSPDLILLDVIMPNMEGFEVCERLQENSTTKNIPIIFITAKKEDEHIVKGFEMGAVDYVTKPFNPIELLARVKIHIELKLIKDQLKKRVNTCRQVQNTAASLSRMLNKCTKCNKIQDVSGTWQLLNEVVDDYFLEFRTQICPDCTQSTPVE